MSITAVIAEDEPILRAQLKSKLGKLWPELQIVADLGDGESALEAIAELQPSLAFLDIQMPELTGIEVAHRLARNPDLQCHLVFVTAYDHYAVQAFETGAIDYLLKPYSDDRLSATIGRLKNRFQPSEQSPTSQDLQTLMTRLINNSPPAAEKLRWIKAGVGDKLRVIPIDEVLFFQADEKYTLVATRESDTLIRTPIRELVNGLDAEVFWQIHRSTIVNATAIDSVSRDIRGQASIKIKDRREQLSVSRAYSGLFKQM